jgi:hypothetical protein
MAIILIYLHQSSSWAPANGAGDAKIEANLIKVSFGLLDGLSCPS